MARAGLLTQLSPEELSPDQESDSTSGKRRAWPTPGAGGALGANPSWEKSSARHAENGQHKQMGLRDAAPRAQGETSGGLNPAWVSQLQGLPDGWLDSNPPADVLASALSETASTRKRSQP